VCLNTALEVTHFIAILKDPPGVVAPRSAIPAAERGRTALGGSSLATGTESPPIAHPMYASDLDPSMHVVVCPRLMARLVVAPTLAAATTSWSGGLVGAPTSVAALMPVLGG